MHGHEKGGRQAGERFPTTGRLRPISGNRRPNGIAPGRGSYAGDLRQRDQSLRRVRSAVSALFAAPGAAMLGRSICGAGASPAARAPRALPSADACSSTAVTSPPKSESELTELEAMDRAFVPTFVEAETETGPVVRMEPSLG